MGVAELRGFLFFAAVVAAIAVIWVRLDDESEAEKADVEVATTTTSSTTTLPPTTTTDPAIALRSVCDQALAFAGSVEQLTEDDDETEIRLAAQFWNSALPDLPSDVQIEAVAVLEYYNSLLDVAEPFDFDPVRIIVEGDKERYEQLLTRPAPGLDTARGFIVFTCSIEVPDKPWMSEKEFKNLEERLLDSDPLGP